MAKRTALVTGAAAVTKKSGRSAAARLGVECHRLDVTGADDIGGSSRGQARKVWAATDPSAVGGGFYRDGRRTKWE